MRITSIVQRRILPLFVLFLVCLRLSFDLVSNLQAGTLFAVESSEENMPSERKGPTTSRAKVHFESFDEYLARENRTKETYHFAGLLNKRHMCNANSAPDLLVDEGIEIVRQKKQPPTRSEGAVARHNQAALCSAIKNEDWYVSEWVNYHLALGFKDIYLFDDNDDRLEPQSRLRQLLSPDHPHVHIIPLQHIDLHTMMMQPAVTDACVKIIKQRNMNAEEPIVWASFMDTDEFILLKKHDYIQEFLHDHCPLPHCGAIGLNWHWFGTGNETYYTNQPVTQRFVYRESKQEKQIKSIFRIDEYLCSTNPHFVHLKQDPTSPPLKPPLAYTTHGTLNLFGARNKESNTNDIAAINHYTKSLEEWYMRRCVTGDVGPKKDLKCNGMYPASGHVKDTLASDFWEIMVAQGHSIYASRLLPGSLPEVDWTHHDESKFGIKEIVSPNKFAGMFRGPRSREDK